MKFSKKGGAPTCLTDHIALPTTEDWQSDYDNFRGKGDVLRALLIEQKFVCAYCGRAISKADSHVEHYYCQTLFPGRQLDYSNMFASCGPAKSKRMPKICGDAKGGMPPPNPCILPSDPDCEAHFTYGIYGAIVPLDQTANEMVGWLNLDDASLRSERAIIIADMDGRIQSGEITSANRQAEILRLRTPPDGRLLSFDHVAARYLEDAL